MVNSPVLISWIPEQPWPSSPSPFATEVMSEESTMTLFRRGIAYPSGCCRRWPFVFRDGDAYVGVDYAVSIDGITFVLFLAVDKRVRSRGYGSRILDQIKADHPDDIIIVSFEPSVEGADGCGPGSRRKAFYLRNGFRETGYAGVMGGKSQEIMVYNGAFDPDSFREFFRKYSNGATCPEIRRLRIGGR